MKDKSCIQARVTGILIEAGKILILKQRVSPERGWSLPGGKLERGETLTECITREMREETGLETRIQKLLYLCEKPKGDKNHLLHITFLLERIGGQIHLPTEPLDLNPIHDVKMVPIDDLLKYGFSEEFKKLVRNGFPHSGNYAGHKSNIGL